MYFSIVIDKVTHVHYNQDINFALFICKQIVTISEMRRWKICRMAVNTLLIMRQKS